MSTIWVPPECDEKQSNYTIGYFTIQKIQKVINAELYIREAVQIKLDVTANMSYSMDFLGNNYFPLF